ncbi:MAG: nitrogen regulation protein NR(II) [bacterium]
MQTKRTKFSLFKFLIRNYVLGIAILNFLIAFTVFRIEKSNLISAREAFAVSVAKALSSEIRDLPFQISPATLDSKDSSQLDRITNKYLKHYGVARINIVDKEKRIVYSTKSNLIGNHLQSHPLLMKSLAGVPASCLHLTGDDAAGGPGDNRGAVLESVIPFSARGDESNDVNEIFGAFQIFQDAVALNEQILKLRNTVLGAAFAFLLLIVLYFWFALAKANRIQLKLRSEVENYAENLESMVADRTEQLMEEKNKLQVILNHVPSAFILVDLDRRIKSSSTALHEFTGQSFSEVKGRFCYDVLCNRKHAVGACPTKKALKSNRPETSILIFKEEEGEDRYVEHSAVPIINNGRTESILEIITDITEKKKMQDAMIQAAKLSAVGQMAATIAHEIRNGLTSVKLILQHLAAYVAHNKRKNKAAAVALESISDMEKVVKELLEFARPRPTCFKTTNINKLLRHSVDICRQQIELKPLILQENYSADIPMLRLDAEHMKEAVVNLILNAIRASRSHEILCVRAKLSVLERHMSDYFTEGKTRIQLKKNQPVAKIEILDNGCGIPAENLTHIFDPFFTTKIDGSGLGLPMTRRTVHEHGGILTVDSQPGQGSRFTIILPV